MPYTPLVGLGSTLALDGTTMDVVDMSCSLEREAIETSLLSDLYRTFTAGRITARVSVTLALDKLIASSVALGFQGQSALGTAITVSYSDGAGLNVYVGNALVISATHTTTGGDRDTLQVELQFTGSIT